MYIKHINKKGWLGFTLTSQKRKRERTSLVAGFAGFATASLSATTALAMRAGTFLTHRLLLWKVTNYETKTLSVFAF